MIGDPPAGRRQPVVAHALLDRDGRLLSAEPMLDMLNRRAGGDIGALLAVPELATIVRLARRLGIIVSRRALVADEEGDLELWARAQIDEDRIRLAVSGWHERPGWTPAGGTIGLPVERDDADGGWRWDTDAALRLTRLSIEAGRRYGFDALALLGQPITALFTLDNDDGQLPLVEAFARREPLVGQRARLRDGGAAMLLSAEVRYDPAARFGGFAGVARPLVAVAAADEAPALAEHFIAGLDRALRRPLAQIVANADSIHGAADGPVAPD